MLEGLKAKCFLRVDREKRRTNNGEHRVVFVCAFSFLFFTQILFTSGAKKNILQVPVFAGENNSLPTKTWLLYILRTLV